MQLSDYTRKLLENFVGINQGIVIRKTPDGEDQTLLRTIARTGEIYAQAIVPETFPTHVVINDLKAFLSVLSGFENPEIDFQDAFLTISEGTSSVRIVYGEPGMVTHPNPAKPFVMPDTDFDFELKQESLQKVLNFSNILGLPNLRLKNNKEGKLLLEATNVKKPNTDNYKIEVGEVDTPVEVYLKREFLKMIPGDYKVSIDNDKAAVFTNLVDQNVVYYIALDIQNAE